MASLSVIIPTHRRTEVLERCVHHLERQTIAKEIEVIVVSDGPDPATAQLFEGSVGKGLGALQFFEIPKSQQGVARNRGVAKATSPLVLFIGDDIFLEPHVCQVHVRTHETLRALPKNGATAVLGFVTWDPAAGITPVMRWLEATGWQFGYPLLAPYAHNIVPREMQHRFTYTSHISVPREIAKKIAFHEDVVLYGWEDIEWGMRLREAGVRLHYEPNARALHHHHMTLDGSLKRMHTLGRSAVHMEQIAPDLHVTPQGWKRIAYHLIALLPTMHGRHAKAFLRGILDTKSHSQ